MRGRKPKPTAVKQLAGNPGKRPLNDREPQFSRILPRCPSHLSNVAKNEWRRVSKELYGQGLLTRVDRAALAAYCQLYARWVQIEGILAVTKPLVTTSNGNVIQNPAISIANRTLEEMRKFMVEFGMTPSARTRVHATASDNEPTFADQLSEWVEQALSTRDEADE